jgi:hypothetical protein
MVVMVHSLPDGAQSNQTGLMHVRVAFAKDFLPDFSTFR